MKVVVSLSGGMDSTTVAGHYLDQGAEVIPVSFSYGSKHNAYENKAAMDVATYYGLPAIKQINLTEAMGNFKSDLLKTGGEIPEGHYEAKSMSATVVPGRNTIFAAMLMGFAQSVEADVVALGVHAGDHHIYPDCRPDFIWHMQGVYFEATEGKVSLEAPFLHATKADILRIGYTHRRQAPYYLTRTCYKDQPISCGLCGSCQERLEAFQLIGREDPIEYENRGLFAKEENNG